MKNTRRTNSSRGNTIIVVMMVVLILSISVLSALNFTSGVSRNVRRTNDYRKAVEVGDGVLEYLFAQWNIKCKTQPNNQLSANTFKPLTLPSASMFPSVSNFTTSTALEYPASVNTVSNIKIQALGPDWKPIADSATPIPMYGVQEASRSYYYLASADVALPAGFGSRMKVNVRQILEKKYASPWQYAIFYTDLLEIHPGPEFHVTGWVHTNDKLYTGHDSLWFESKVTYVTGWERAFAPGDNAHNGETPKWPHYPTNISPDHGDPQNPMGLSLSAFDTTNPNNKGYREIIERPVTGYSDPIGEDRIFNTADVKILVKDESGNQVVHVYKTDNTEVTASSASAADKDLYNAIKGAVTVGDKIQDNREGKEIKLVTIDVSKITAAYTGGKLPGFKGVIYASDINATSSDRRGIRLKNGGIMPNTGLTVATDNPAYIQGDYNTGTNGSTQPNSNQSGGDPLKNTVTGYNLTSSAVLADAVQILSNSWSDANSYKSVGNRVATPTTVNAAIVSGIVPSGSVNGANYSGGAENFPRFMETWGSGNTFTYHGSMVQLYKSEQNVGSWGAGNVYDPPKRQWFFEKRFYTDPPPGLVKTVTYKKRRWYTES